MTTVLIALLAAAAQGGGEPEAEWKTPVAESRPPAAPVEARAEEQAAPAAPAVAREAEAPRAAPRVLFSASVMVGSQVLTQRAYDAFDEDDHLVMVSVALGASFAVPRGRLDVELAFHGGSTGAMLHRTQPVSLSLRCTGLSVAYRLPLLRFFHPYVKVGGGVDVASLSLLSGMQLQQTVVQPSGVGLLGFQVPLVLSKTSRREPALVGSLEAGYALRPGYAFNALAPPASATVPEQPIAHGATNAGTLGLSGFVLRLGFAFRL